MVGVFVLVLALACSSSDEDAEIVAKLSAAAQDPPTGRESTLGIPIIDGAASCRTDLEELPRELISSSERPGSMGAPRRWHTATVLNDGRILVTGGNIRRGVTASAEIFDPETELFRVTAYMSDRRVYHTATVLNDGGVLVVGGQPSIYRCPVVGAEIYDSVEERWVQTGDLSGIRRSHEALLLKDGRVLITGGMTKVFGGVTAAAEVYDPESGEWTLVEPMTIGRWGHSMTLLSDGRVLVVGGRSESNQPLGSIEIFDPASGKWSQAGMLVSARAGHTAVLTAVGTVMIVSGSPAEFSVEIFDPSTGELTPGPTLGDGHPHPENRAVVMADGRVLVGGGYGGDRSPVTSIVGIFDPDTGTWTTVKNMSFSRVEHLYSLLPDGRIVVTGGRSLTGPVGDAELYDPIEDDWDVAGSLFED